MLVHISKAIGPTVPEFTMDGKHKFIQGGTPQLCLLGYNPH